VERTEAALHVVVIGAGMVGVSVAARLAERGARVTLVDRDEPGGGTTSTSFAWVNAGGKEPHPYFALNRAGLEAHHRLSDEGGNWLGRGGHVEIAVDEAHRTDLAGRRSRLVEYGYEAEAISVDRARELLPDVRIPHDAGLIVFFPREAHAFPLVYVGAMLERARAAGAEVRTGVAVTGLRGTHDAGAEVVLEDGTVLRADRVVAAVGRWSAELGALAGVSVPMRRFEGPGDITVGYLAETNPLPVRLERVVTTPWLNVRPAAGGRLLLQALDLDATADPHDVPSLTSPLAETLLRRLRAAVRGTEGARLEKLVVGQRAMPADGRTIASPAPEAAWLYIVATHSGVTLAPYLGEVVAEEVLGTPSPALEAFRLERFLAGRSLPEPSVPRRPGQQ
jgi:glycine/D-amino acid oxidase-like deaminating enzyme